MTEATPVITRNRGWSPLWLLPAAALIGGLWMVIQTYLAAGPTIYIDFETADGIEAGKTKVKMLNVDVGLVETVALRKDAVGVRATVSLEKPVLGLLREETQFWIVRARVGSEGISGISTLLSGGYIELAPGAGEAGKRRFVGRESPPLTPVGAPGKRLRLVSERASVGVGQSVFFQEFKAGRIEAVAYDPVRLMAVYDVFIDAPFDRSIVSSTRFWDVSGLSLEASADGIHLQVSAVEALLRGGIAFGTPSELPPGEPVAEGAEFTLYGSYSDILKNPYQHGAYYVVQFDQALGGLVPGAPVKFRGILIGQVERILLSKFSANGVYQADQPIPVLVYLEPGRLEVPDTAASVEGLTESLNISVGKGMRATLQLGNLLTGSQQISLDFYPDAAPTEPSLFDGYPVIPSIETGVGRIENQLTGLLAKLNSLPMNDTFDSANNTLTQASDLLNRLNSSAESLNQLLAADDTQRLTGELLNAVQELNVVMSGYTQDSALYQDLRAAVGSLDQSLANLESFTKTLADKPNALVFSKTVEADPEPKAKP